MADRTTLTGELSDALAGLRKPRARHDPGRVLVDLAVAVADGATTISDVAVLADQAALFGAVASDSTCWRLLDRPDDARLAAVAAARAREVVWAQDARVEDRIRTGKDTGLNHFPSRAFAINQAWLAVVMLAVDLLAWTQRLLLDGDLAKAEPTTLRYRLLHVAARLTRGQRRLWVRIQQPWPWARVLAAAFARLQALPVPAG